ncbi:MAG: protein kinase [Clostridia bacterium]|nr:protein kinase [Clostridia bacterium]
MYTLVSVLNKDHQVFLVRRDDGKICVQKNIKIYNIAVYEYLKNNHIAGTPIIYDFYEQNNELIIIEEFIEGDSLSSIIDSQCSLDINEGIQYVIQLLGTLKNLHEIKPSIVHRDLKPSNIIINSDNEPILIDFNVAKLHDDTSIQSRDTALFGTVGYAAPEQYGFGVSTIKTDIYAVGVILQDILNKSIDISKSQQNDLIKIIAKCTELNPDDRFETVKELETALRNNINLYSRNTGFWSYVGAVLRKYAFPGFRTGKIWKMIVASLVYAMIIFISARITVEGGTEVIIALYRIIFFALSLALIFCTFNYRNIQRCAPFARSKNFLLRIFGVALFNICVLGMFLFLLVLGVNIFG